MSSISIALEADWKNLLEFYANKFRFDWLKIGLVKLTGGGDPSLLVLIMGLTGYLSGFPGFLI